jgi:hypothetical protein
MPDDEVGSPLANHLDEQVLAEVLQSTLRSTLFSSGLTVSPRQVNKVGTDIASLFFAFYGDCDDTAVQAAGLRYAEAGLGRRSLLAMTEALQRACRQLSNPLADLPDIAGAYVNALLEGYMAGREEQVRQEQERTLQAYLRASAQRGGDAD